MDAASSFLFRVQGLGLRVQGSGFRVYDSEFYDLQAGV